MYTAKPGQSQVSKPYQRNTSCLEGKNNELSKLCSLQQDRNTMFNLPKTGERAAPAPASTYPAQTPRPAPRSELPDQLPKFTVTPAPPATANGPGKEFGWGRTWMSPVAAVPAQAAPEGSTEPSLVTNSIKTHPVKKGLAQSEPKPGGRIPSSVSPGCQPRGFWDLNSQGNK